MKRITVVLASVAWLAGCQARPGYLKPALTGAGEVYVYLQPFPQRGDRLRFSIGSMFAVRDDGARVPLSIEAMEAEDLGVAQRLAASGMLPPGLYKGLSLEIRNAFVQGEEGEASLLVPEEPAEAAQTFRINRGKAMALFLAFDPSKAVSEGFRFSPTFSVTLPRRELTNLIGYVTNSGSNILSVFNKRTMELVGVIATGGGPEGIVLDQERKLAYVAVSREDAVEVVDVVTGEVTSRMRLSPGDSPRELALSPDGRTLVTANHGSNTASVIDPLSLVELRRIPVGSAPQSVVVDRSGRRAYVMNTLSNTISVIDLPRGELTATLGVDGMPQRAAFNRNGDRLYVTVEDSPNLTVVDSSRISVAGTIFVGLGAISVAVDTRTDLIYVGKRIGGEIAVVDPFASAVIDRIDIDGSAAFMTIDTQENTLLVVVPDRGALRRVNLVGRRVAAETEVLEGAYAVGVIGER